MPAAGLLRYLALDLETDTGFREELRKMNHLGVQLVGGLEAAVPLLMLAAGISVIPARAADGRAAMPNIVIALIGGFTLALSAFSWSRRYARLIMAVSVWLSSAVLEWSLFLLQPNLAWSEHYLIGYITLVKFAAAALPFRPIHTLALGICVDLFYLFSWFAARDLGLAGTGFGWGQHLFTLITTPGCTGLTIVIYQQRASNYQTHQRALRASEDLRHTQARLLISENAAAMGRLSAALSHELNSPIGVLSSAVDTLATAASKKVNGEEQSARLSRIVEETRLAAKGSADRLRTIVARMQRFTNLDRAEVQSVDINEILGDVVALLEPHARGRAQIDLKLRPLPRLLGRPQQLSAVFSNLLGNSIDAVEENGRILVSTAPKDTHLEIMIADNGRGMQEEELANLFNPATFRVSGNRMAAGNWSLFSCRRIIQEHGGEVRVDSSPGSGTTVVILLPQDAGRVDSTGPV